MAVHAELLERANPLNDAQSAYLRTLPLKTMTQVEVELIEAAMRYRNSCGRLGFNAGDAKEELFRLIDQNAVG